MRSYRYRHHPHCHHHVSQQQQQQQTNKNIFTIVNTTAADSSASYFSMLFIISLPRHALLTLVRALIVSKVDYCNSVLAGMSRHLHDRLQSVLNAAALVYRCLHGMAPSYLADDLQLTSTVGTRRQLRSADSPTLVVRSTRRSTLGDRAFPVAAARAWNILPPAVRDAPSLLSFRSRLKTWLFELTLA